MDLVVGDCMKQDAADARAGRTGRAARCASWRSGTSLRLVVADAERKPLGVVHLHDLWTLELF